MYVGKRVGFTGTQKGLRPAQRRALIELLKSLKPIEFHHGDCIGTDQEGCYIAQTLLKPAPRIVSHPPTKDRKRAFTTGNDETRPKRDYLVRNQNIVGECDLLIGCPKYRFREGSGGTWYTVGYAEGQQKPRFIVWPDGEVTQPDEEVP